MVKVNIFQLLTVAVLQFIINDKTLHSLFSFSRWELNSGQSIDIIKFVKYDTNKRFLCMSVSKCAKMYNMLASTTCKISTATFYKYKSKAVKLQGCIPFRQSCCKKCQNFENVINEAAKYLHGVPHDIDNVIDRTMCPYTGYFSKLPCIFHMCDHCGEAKFQNKLVDLNKQIVRYKKEIHGEVLDHKTERK